MAEREIKTVLTLDDVSFSKGLKAAASDVKATTAEMNAAIAKASGLGKGFRQAAAQVTGLGKVVKAQKSQMQVLSKEYQKQTGRLQELKKEYQEALKAKGEDSAEAKRAAEAYAAQSAAVNDLREKMAKLQTQMRQNKQGIQQQLTAPLRAAGRLAENLATVAVGALAAGAAALGKFTVEADAAQENYRTSVNSSRAVFSAWSLFLEMEAKKARENVGVTTAEYMQIATETGLQLQQAGVPVQQSAEWVAQAIELAGQLHDRFGVPVAQAMQDITAAATGENKDALNKYGVAIGDINSGMSGSQRAARVLKTAMHQVDASADQYLQKQNTVRSKTAELNTAWENFKAGVGSAEDVADAAAGLAATFGEKFTEITATALKIAPAVWEALKTSMAAGFKTNVWPELAPLLNDTFGKLFGGTELPVDWNEFTRLLQQGWDQTKKDIAEFFKAPFGIELPNWEDIMKGITEIWSTVKERVSDFFKKPFEIIAPVVNTVKKAVENVWNAVKSRVNLVVKAFIVPEMSEAEQKAYDVLTSANPAELLSIDGGAAKQGLKNLLGFAGGLFSVPYDNYLARLHAGEEVLTADQARRYRAAQASGGVTYNDSAAIYIDKYNQYSGADADGLLAQMQAIQRRRRVGYGLA